MYFIKQLISVLSIIALLTGCNNHKSLPPGSENKGLLTGLNNYKSLPAKPGNYNPDTGSEQSIWQDYDNDIYSQIKKDKSNKAKGFSCNGTGDRVQRIRGHNRDTYTNVERSKLRRELGLPNNAATDRFWRIDDFGHK